MARTLIDAGVIRLRVNPEAEPEGATFEVSECLLVVLNEEWWHRMYAERDLAVLEG